MIETSMKWDVFISHASEDKEAFVRPLAQGLIERGFTVWFDEFTLTVGDSLRQSIDQGLAHSRFGIVVISRNFLEKEWPQKELDGLVAREAGGIKVILPVWHEIDAAAIRSYSPLLADRLAVCSDRGLDHVVAELIRAIRRDHPNGTRDADRWPSGQGETSPLKGTPPKIGKASFFDAEVLSRSVTQPRSDDNQFVKHIIEAKLEQEKRHLLARAEAAESIPDIRVADNPSIHTFILDGRDRQIFLALLSGGKLQSWAKPMRGRDDLKEIPAQWWGNTHFISFLSGDKESGTIDQTFLKYINDEYRSSHYDVHINRVQMKRIWPSLQLIDIKQRKW